MAINDRLNALQQYLDFYKNRGGVAGGGSSAYERETGAAAMNARSDPLDRSGNDMMWANNLRNADDKRQNESEQNAIFANMFNGNSAQMPQYVQPQQNNNQSNNQNNPYATRAMQLNNNPYAGSGGGQDISNSLAAMLKPKNYSVG